MYENEEWREVIGFSGYYEVSSRGRVRSVDRVSVCKDGRVMERQGIMIRPATAKNGSPMAMLSVLGRRSNATIARLVAQAFIGVPFEARDVYHRDGNPENNCVENLEWRRRSDMPRESSSGERHYTARRRAAILLEETA